MIIAKYALAVDERANISFIIYEYTGYKAMSYLWLVIIIALVLVNTAQGGFNVNSFGDAVGNQLGHYLIGLGCVFIWWIATKNTLSAKWKWFDYMNAAAFLMFILFMARLIITPWAQSRLEQQHSAEPFEQSTQQGYANQPSPVPSTPPTATFERYTPIPPDSAPVTQPPVPMEPAPTIAGPSDSIQIQANPKSTAKWEGSRAQKCQLQYFADIEMAEQDIPLAEYAEIERKAKQKQRACNSR